MLRIVATVGCCEIRCIEESFSCQKLWLWYCQVLSPKDVRFLLLQTWLQPLVDDFAWMQRCCRNLDKKVVEEGISQTILTLPLKQQQTILLSWFDRFSSSGDDCPNLQKAFEVWWRRTFTRPSVEEDNCGPQPSFWAPKGLGHTERWMLLHQACIRTSLERCICCYMWSWAIICWEEDLRFDLLARIELPSTEIMLWPLIINWG